MLGEIVPLVARDTDKYNRRPMHIPLNIQICHLLEYSWQKSGRCYSCNSIRISNIHLQMHTFGMETVQLLLKSILFTKTCLKKLKRVLMGKNDFSEQKANCINQMYFLSQDKSILCL